MKYHMAFKFIAFVLCACFLFLTAGAAVCTVVVATSGLYSSSVEDMLLQRMESNLRNFADSLAKRYAAENLSNCPNLLIEKHVYTYYPPLLTEDEQLWFYSIKNQKGQILEARVSDSAFDDAMTLEFLVSPSYPVVLDYEVIDRRPGSDHTIDDPDKDIIPGETQTAPEEAEYEYIETVSYEDEDGVVHNYRLGVCQGPVYLVTLYLLPGAYARETHWSWDVARIGHENRFNLLWILAASALALSATLVYLCCSAGKNRESGKIYPDGLNRIPLDLYAAVTATAVTWMVIGSIRLMEWYMGHFEPMWLVLLAVGALGLGASLLVCGLIFALAAQVKVPDGWWLRHTALAWFGKHLFRFLRKAFPAVRKVCVATGTLIWKALKTAGRWLRNIYRCVLWSVKRFYGLLPLTWQWLLVAALIILTLWLTIDAGIYGRIIGIGICLILVLYGAYCYGMLLENTKRMSKGDLDTKVDDRLLLGSFQEYAAYLNALADVAVDAARKQMKSERMKAELITNISHDIKTPLTSIINYVDLMQRVQSPEEAQAYLEVLNRQAQRLKKLIEDLMEMSKASTGNMNVTMVEMDAVETVNQALGEFYEKLENASLTPVFTHHQESVMMTADGRLAWRVLSNLLSNAVKYAMPGTRLYVDLEVSGGQVHISLKNISREPLNVSPDELTERFVRGDVSRNTEGSGLGLNIARSLMELQKGKLQLYVDGDFFKATVSFNCVPSPSREKTNRS